MPSVKLITNKHNKTVLDPPSNSSEGTYNCINKEKFSLQEKCFTNNMYKATSTSNQDTSQYNKYYGIIETKSKQRYANDAKSLRHEKHQSDTEFSNEIWSIKNNNYTLNAVREILRKHQPYKPNTKRCS